MKTKKIATYGLLIALAFILSYIEHLFQLPIPVPGIKIGLANLVVLTALYSLGVKEAFALSVLRIILVGFTFGSPSTMMFSMAGGLLSWFMMSLLKGSKRFGIVGVSIVGGVSHNVGQILVAMIILDTMKVIYYLGVLLISGIITGVLIGLLGGMIVSRMKKILRD